MEFSIGPIELKRLVNESKLVWKSLGNVKYGVHKENEKEKRSIYALKDLKKVK